MKQILSIFSLLLLCSTVTLADEVRVLIADDITNGSVSYTIEGSTVSLTVTPNDGYYLQTINAAKTIDASTVGTTRADAPAFGVYTLTRTSASALLNEPSAYTFTLDDGLGAYVTAQFAARSEMTADLLSLSTASFVYNGASQVPSVQVGSLTSGTHYTVSYAQESATNVGTYTLTVTGINNYQGELSATWAITEKPLAITADAQSKVYGTVDPAFTYTAEGLVEGESLSGALARAEGEAVGEYAITQGNLAASSNYTVTFTGAKLTITAATLTGVAATPYSGTYDGAAHTISVAIPEGAAIMYGSEQGNCDNAAAPSYTNAGEYTVYYQVTKANYNTVTGSAKVNISKKALTITADAKTKVYGEADPALTYKVEGLIEGESLSGALTRAQGEDVGEYNITQGTLTASDNYTVTFTGAKFTITVNEEVVNTDNSVKEGDETFYQPSESVQNAISNNVNTGIAFTAEASKDVKVNENGGLEFGKNDKNVDVALTDMHKGETVTFNIEGTMQADASKLKELGTSAARSTRSTRAPGKIDIVSGKEYEVLEDGNIVITIVLTSSAATINSIKKAAASSATGIEGVNPATSSETVSDKWYMLNGQPLQSKPAKKGIYIHKGRKEVIK